MATEIDRQTSVTSQPLVKITEMDHIVLRVKDVEESLRFYTEVLGMKSERVDQWRAGEIRFPSARINADTIIDFFGKRIVDHSTFRSLDVLRISLLDLR